MMRALLVSAALLVLATGAAAAQQPSEAWIEQKTREVASELRCPVCQGTSIEASPSELALEMKAVVREQLEAGRSPEEVKAYFVAKYGEWILLRPRAEGLNLAVYVVPILALLGGALFLGLAVRRWTRDPADDVQIEEPKPHARV